ncbi:MAG: zinc-dependent metalloprotease [Ignavibacteria bacterium]|nr:zinc-dependent metalloprotease [Ignavibacteria bacterium]
MKKLIYILTAIFFSILINTSGFSTEKKNESFYSGIITKLKNLNNLLYKQDLKLFTVDYDKSLKAGLNEYSAEATILALNLNSLELFYKNPDDNINFIIPTETDKIVLSLKRTEILENDFDLISLNKDGKRKKIKYIPGLYYCGMIKGKSESFAAVSIFKNSIMGIISDERGNFVIGEYKIQGRNNSYVFYNDLDLKIRSKFKCRVGDIPDKFYKTGYNIKNRFNEQMHPDLQKLPVKMYFEADYELYKDFNYNLNDVGNFVTGFFNVVSYMYQRENIPFTLKSIEVWTTADPYSYYEDPYTILMLFGGNSKDDFEGNLAHLISSGHNQQLGGIAWVGVLCQEFNSLDSSGRFAFSNIEPDYNGFPTYSWTVNCVTHEIGHNLGSMHTHACWWPLPNNTIGALDSCYYAEQGFCFPTPKPSVGTIMSYCHLWIGQGGSVNFNLGFGPLPGDTIRLRYNQAGCLDRELNSSENPIVYDLAQNFPNPFNPTTTIKYAVPEDAVVKITVYDLSGKEAAVLVNEFKKVGFYNVIFNASNLPSGVYFYRMQAGNFSQTKQMIFLK